MRNNGLMSIKKRLKSPWLLMLIALNSQSALTPLPANAEEFTVDQKDRKFGVKRLTIKAGDSINFLNNDPYFHNVFSLSEVRPFDLGSYPKGQSRKLDFKTKGIVEVECAIHPEMQMTVEVK